MNIQIFGTAKSFDTKKAQRWFQERRIKFQFVDLKRYELSPKEFDSVLHAVGGVDQLADYDSRDEQIHLLRYLSGEEAKADKLFENQQLLRQPIVRCGRRATVGYCPDVWTAWLKEETQR